MVKCILFDRDGTLGNLSDLRFPQTFTPFTDIQRVFKQLKDRGYLVGIITNQSSIARGTALGYDYDAEFQSYGVDAYAICPHDNQDNCPCRKPKSGLLLQVCEQLAILPDECLIVGDRLSDILCAKNVGAEAVLVTTGYGMQEKETVLNLYPDTKILESFDQITNVV
jgi:HAD superfamily hydrolase (TIGR01662 family)